MDSDSSTDDEETLVVYTCKKCPGQEFTKKNMQAHREFHKSAKKRRQRRFVKFYVILCSLLSIWNSNFFLLQQT